MQFRATIQLAGKTATGITVPDKVVAALGGGNRPPSASPGRYNYQTTVARMGGVFMFPVSAAVRQQADVAAGELVEVEVEIELDKTPRELAIPAALAQVLDRHPDAKTTFGALSYTNQKRYVLAVEAAKTVQTRQRRLDKILDVLQAHASRRG